MSDLSLQKLYDHFEVAALLEGSTKHRCSVAVKTMLRCFGETMLAECLDGQKICQWQLWCKSQGMSGSTIRSGFTAVAQVYKWGLEEKLLASNPFATAHKLRMDRQEVQTFTADEVMALCDAAAGLQRRDKSAQLRWYALLLIIRDTGIRIGEVLNLRWEDFDWNTENLRVQYRPDRFGEYWTWGTKGKTDRRVPVGLELLECCYRLREVAKWRYPILKRCTCERLQKSVGSIPEEIRKFPYQNLYREFRQIRHRANVQRIEPIKDGCFHMMRKTAVSTWVAEGASLTDVQYVAGHASMQTTRTYYVAVNADRSIERIRAANAAKWAR
jgi:integrase